MYCLLKGFAKLAIFLLPDPNNIIRSIDFQNIVPKAIRPERCKSKIL